MKNKKLATIVEGDQKAPFSIDTTQKKQKKTKKTYVQLLANNVLTNDVKHCNSTNKRGNLLFTRKSMTIFQRTKRTWQPQQ